ncbi:hypothetical protein [Streptomyces sp. NPDC096132]|uniref:hypothetical protein n=1 Tax=Streptomyces sp. NPDC096132 TaxID=3366075 RepID=UPI0037F93EBD
MADGLTSVDDFNFLNDRSDLVFAALNRLGQVVVVRPGRATETVLTVSDGLASPTSVAVRGNRIYVTNAGFPEPTTRRCSGGRPIRPH